jgi:hypothetical protein
VRLAVGVATVLVLLAGSGERTDNLRTRWLRGTRQAAPLTTSVGPCFHLPDMRHDLLKVLVLIIDVLRKAVWANRIHSVWLPFLTDDVKRNVVLVAQPTSLHVFGLTCRRIVIVFRCHVPLPHWPTKKANQ